MIRILVHLLIEKCFDSVFFLSISGYQAIFMLFVPFNVVGLSTIDKALSVVSMNKLVVFN
jgi:hypothetical protein